MIRDILSVRLKGECKFCITPDTPFFFCGEPTAPGSSYCAPHHAICHSGFGKDIGALESMIYGIEGNVTRKASTQPNTTPVDVQMRGPE